MFEYSVYFASIADSEPRKSMIAIRALEGMDIDQLSISFEAESIFARYVDTINLKNISKKPVFCLLPNLPQQDFIQSHEKIGLIFAWDSYRLDILDLKFSNIDRKITNHSGITSHLSHTWLLNSSWVNYQGKCWNTDAIEECKRTFYLWWNFRFGKPKVIVYSPYRIKASKIKVLKNILLQPIINLIIWIATRNAALSFQFWIATSSNLFILTDDSRLQWRWSTESKPFVN